MFKFEKAHLRPSLSDNQWRVYWILSRGSVLSIAVLAFHFLHPSIAKNIRLPRPNGQNQFEATSIFASTLLTFALIAVYRDIGETQSIQAKTQQNQETLLEMERRPYVEVVGYDTYETHQEQDRLWISNHGQGVALELSLVAKIDFDSRGELEPGVCSKPISRIDDTNMSRQDRSIPPGRAEVGFNPKCCIGLNYDTESEGKPIPHAFAEIQGAEISQVQFQLYVMYWNPLGEAGLAKVTTPRSINLEGLSDGQQIFYLDDLFAHSEPFHVLEDDFDFEELRAEELIDNSSDASVEPDIINPA